MHFATGGFSYETPVPGTVQTPPPTPVINVNNTGETRKFGGNTAHGHIISINNKTTSEGGTITGQNGKPTIVANNNTGSETGTVYGPSGKPQMKATNTTSSQTATVNGSDGKPQYEVEKFDNGTSVITFFGSDGKPSFHMTYQAPPGNENSNTVWTAPPGFSFPPPN